MSLRFVIAATHRSIEDMIQEGLFRKNLWFRMNQHIIAIPPLRDRLEDIPLLVDHYLREKKNTGVSLHPEALKKLMEYPWEGNVRELYNVIGRALTYHPDEKVILAEHIELDHRPPRAVRFEFDPEAVTLEELKRRLEEEYIHRLVKKYGKNTGRIAEGIGKSKRTVYRWLSKRGVLNKSKQNPEEEKGAE